MPGRKNLVVIACGVVLIALGFVSLAKGSITLAPILLVAGYCVVIPLGLLVGIRREGKPARDTGEERANSSVG